MQSPDFNQNYFALFGLQPDFDIDCGSLHGAQQRLQASFHPDRQRHSNAQEKRLSVQGSAWINQAYETLRDPVKRARYLLEINGAELPDETTTTADGAFLMEQLELREEIDACREAEDAVSRCEQIAQRLEQRAAELASEFSAGLKAGNLEAALQSSRKMQFVQRIQQQLAELQFELEDI